MPSAAKNDEKKADHRSPHEGRESSQHSTAHTEAFEGQFQNNKSQDSAPANRKPQSRPGYEKELIRLMLLYHRDMINYIGMHCREQQFEDEDLRKFYEDIINRYKKEEEVSVEVYAAKDHPYPELVGEIMLEEYEVSERHQEKVGVRYKRDKHPYQTAKGALKASKMHFLNRLQDQLQQKFTLAEGDERKSVMKDMTEVGRQRTMLQKLSLNELFPDPDSEDAGKLSEKKFEYHMKGEE